MYQAVADTAIKDDVLNLVTFLLFYSFTEKFVRWKRYSVVQLLTCNITNPNSILEALFFIPRRDSSL